MNIRTRYVLVLILALLAGVAIVVAAWAAPLLAPQAAGAPELVAYQGEVRIDGVPYNGDGYFKFAVVRALGATTVWSNDGTSTAGSPPVSPVPLPASVVPFPLPFPLSSSPQAATARLRASPVRAKGAILMARDLDRSGPR